MLFPFKKNKINYIYNYYKSTAFNIIKARFIKGGVLFKTSKEIIKLINSNFSTFNPISDAEATIYNLDFIIKEGEKFNTFLVRFLSTITPL